MCMRLRCRDQRCFNTICCVAETDEKTNVTMMSSSAVAKPCLPREPLPQTSMPMNPLLLPDIALLFLRLDYDKEVAGVAPYAGRMMTTDTQITTVVRTAPATKNYQVERTLHEKYLPINVCNRYSFKQEMCWLLSIKLDSSKQNGSQRS